MNLIKDQWIPVIRADGSQCNIAPWEIGAGENPVVEIMAPRPDFRGALYQFLIGLVQTAFAPEDDDEWEDQWNNHPSCKELKKAFYKFAEAFELVNENGPAFMQDYNLPDKAEESDIRALLIDAPGDNTIKKNLDHFVKRNSVSGLCDSCSATALFSLQTNAPAGGQGHRTGLRGGGPLTTLVIPNKANDTIWEVVWLNILTHDESRPAPKKIASDVFPWMDLTRESTNNKETFPEQVNELQLYWGMPRRIRLNKYIKMGTCDICGCTSRIWKNFRSINYGIKYSSTWQHTLSPYRRQEEKNGGISLIATKGKQGGFVYPDWLSLALVNDPTKAQTAKVIKSFVEKKKWLISNNRYRIWCSGYDMDNMKARCWYDQTMPIILVPADKQVLFIDDIQKMVAAADTAANLLQNQVKAAWFKRPKDAKGDTSFIRASFWEDTETTFYTLAYKIRDAIVTGAATVPILENWRKIIIDSAERLFDRFALQDTDEVKNMKRIAEASKALSNIIRSPKTKSIQALREVV